MRRIATYGDGPSVYVRDVLQAVFAAELLAPSRDVWVVSPWISNITVLDNRGGEFAALLPGAAFRELTLIDILIVLAEHGTRLHVVTRGEASNQYVLDRLSAAGTRGTAIDVRIRPRVHDKGLLTDRIYLQGSMNFTHHGRARNEEGLTVTNDRHAISRMHIDFEGRFDRVAAP